MFHGNEMGLGLFKKKMFWLLRKNITVIVYQLFDINLQLHGFKSMKSVSIPNCL